MFPIKALQPSSPSNYLHYECEDAAYETLALFTHLLRQMGSSRGKTTFPFLLFLILHLDNEETNPHLVTDGLKLSFIRTTFPSCPHISFPRKDVSPRGAEGRGGSAAPPSQALVGAALSAAFFQQRLFHTASTRGLGAAGAGQLLLPCKGLRLCADCTDSCHLCYFTLLKLN